MAAVVAMLPTPYTADEIKEAFQPGLAVAFDLTDTTRQDWLVDSATADTVTIAFTTAQKTESCASTFEELRAHAEFPAENTTRERGSWTTALGPLEGWAYVVAGEGTTKTFWFADGHAGPPVRMTVQAGDTEVFRMEMVKRGMQP